MNTKFIFFCVCLLLCLLSYITDNNYAISCNLAGVVIRLCPVIYNKFHPLHYLHFFPPSSLSYTLLFSRYSSPWQFCLLHFTDLLLHYPLGSTSSDFLILKPSSICTGFRLFVSFFVRPEPAAGLLSGDRSWICHLIILALVSPY